MLIKVKSIESLHKTYALILCSKETKDYLFIAALISGFNNSEGFKFTKELKQGLSNKIECSPRTLDKFITRFKNNGFLIKSDKGYIINPQFKFKGDNITIGYENKG